MQSSRPLQTTVLLAPETASRMHCYPSMSIFALQTTGLPAPQMASCSRRRASQGS